MTVILRDLLSPPAIPGITTPVLYIESAAWSKIVTYARLSDKLEINGFAYIESFDGDYWLHSSSDVFITKQTVAGGSAEVEGNIFAKALYQATQDDRADDLRLQWHSHVDMNAFFSNTDTDNIDSYGQAGMQYFLSLVMNKRGELSARVDVFNPVRLSASLRVVLFDGTDWGTELQEDIKQKVTVRPAVKFATRAKKAGAAVLSAATPAVAPVVFEAPAEPVGAEK